MRAWLTCVAVVSVLFAVPMPTAALQSDDLIAAAVANEARPQADRDRDELRKPAETLAWAGVRPGARVMDLVPGGGYFTRILSGAVGPEGHVYALQPAEVVNKFSAYRQVMDDLDAETGWDNVSFHFDSVSAFSMPEPLDMVFTALNYHDFHAEFMGPADVSAVNRAVFNALKPGGVYVIIDHHALAGSGVSEVNRIHRIDVEVVKREVLAAGFILEAETDLLAHPEDDRTTHVYEARMRGRTDQFVLKFRKPM